MYRKIASNTIAQIFSKVITAIIAIFLISVLTNYLSVEMYWLYTKIYNYIGIFVFLADLWLYAISIREISNNKKDSSKIVWNVMSLRLILGIFILFLSLFIAYFIPWYNSILALLSIFIASIFTILQLLNSSILALMQANMKVEFSAVSLIFWKILNLWLVAFIAYFLYPKEIIESSSYFTPFLYIMFAGVISVFVNTLMNYFYAKKIVNFWFDFDWSYIKHLFKISLPYWIALFLSVVYFKIDVILLSILEWPEKWDVSIALYSLPMKIVEVIMVLGWFYMTSILPSLTSYFKEKNNISLKQLIEVSFKVLFAFASVVFFMWILFRDYVIMIIANEDYLITEYMYNSSDAFLVVMWVILFYFISLVFIYSLVASENQNKLLKINIFVTIFNILWNIILIPKYSFIWAWITTLLSQILLFLFWYFYTKKIINFNIPYLFIFRSFIIWFIIFLFGYLLINNYWINLYFDFFVFWALIFLVYSSYYYFEFKWLLKKNLHK